MAKCINCNDIELKNPKAKYCSDKCRMAFKRKAINLNDKVFGPQPEQRTRTEHNPNTKGITLPDKTDLGNTLTTTQTVSATKPERDTQNKPRPPGLSDSQWDYLHGSWDVHSDESRDKQPNPERTAQGNIRVSKPGDADYVPMCETTRAFVRDSGLCPYCLKRPILGDNAIACEECSQMTLVDTPKLKRGKDIKCFGDLPMDVREVIHKLSTTDGKIDQTIKANRTAIAVNYQHQFPDRFHSTGVN